MLVHHSVTLRGFNSSKVEEIIVPWIQIPLPIFLVMIMLIIVPWIQVPLSIFLVIELKENIYPFLGHGTFN